MKKTHDNKILQGVAASSGLAVGRVCFWSDPEFVPRYPIQPEKVVEELSRLDEALEISRKQIEKLRLRVEQELGGSEASIFTSHNLLLDDPSFYAHVEKKLIVSQVNVEAAVQDAIEDIVQVFMKIPDAYLRERANDFRDIGRRVLDNLMSYQRQCTLNEGEQVVMVARELMPSDTVHFHRQRVGAFVTEYGGVSSHAAILARSLRLPAVVGVPDALSSISSGTRVLVDGYHGQIILDPTPEQIAAAAADAEQRLAAKRPGRVINPARTQDGAVVTFSANLTREDEVEDALTMGAIGIGLLRTEFLFMDHGEFLNEEEQYQAYRYVVEKMAPHPVTIRTLDLGEDKQLAFGNPNAEEQASCILGWRSIRLSLAHDKIFLAQIKAILRAAVHGPVRMLLPMVNGVEEVRAVSLLVEDAVRELQAEGKVFQAPIPIGAMVETPAAAISPEILLQAADFLSVGTNDLVQYVMVADRVSEKMQPYYRSSSPSVLKLLKGLVDITRGGKKDLSLCGEIAGEPMYLPLLLGLGFRALSVAPVLLPDLTGQVSKLNLAECEALAQNALRLSTADEVYELLKSFKT